MRRRSSSGFAYNNSSAVNVAGAMSPLDDEDDKEELRKMKIELSKTRKD